MPPVQFKIQRTVDKMNEMFRTLGMKINSAKTKILVFVRDPKIIAGVHVHIQDSQTLNQIDDKLIREGNCI